MRRKGFTLVELITVIAIIGILIIIAVPIYNNMSGNTQEKAYENKVKLVEIAAANYAENFKNELKVSTEKVCVSINTLIKEEFLTSDGKNELYLTNPNLNGIEKTEHLMGSVELRYENDEIVAKYDLAGNCGIHVEKQIIDGNKYEIDVTPPTGSMRIIEGDFTNNTRIHLELTLPDADAAYFCYSYTNTEECMIYKDIKDYNIKKIEYNLANNNDGVHHVFLWLKDKYGNVSNPLSDSILYDKVKPTGTITINNGNKYTNNPNVNLKFTYTDQQPASGVYEMCVSNTNTCPENGWESDKETRSWTLESIEGNRTVTVWFKDRAGNISIPYTAVIMLDTIKPTNLSVFINGNAPYTNKAEVTLTISSFDATSGVEKMCVSETPTCPDANWIDYATTHSMTLSGNDGQKFVYVKFRDRALNVSETTSDDIFLDRVDPTCTNHGDSTVWTKDDRTIHYGCADTNGSGCDPAFSGGSKLFNTTTKTFNIDPYTIKDRAGNKTDCDLREANVYVDKIRPDCGKWTPSPAAWKNSNGAETFTLSESTDADSDIKIAGGKCTTALTTHGATCSFIIEDNAGNQETCTSPINRVDLVNPSSPTITVSEVWTKAAKVDGTITGGNDNESGFLKRQYKMERGGQEVLAWTDGNSFSVTEEGQTKVYARTVDVSGRVSTVVSKIVKIDRTGPSLASFSNSSSGNWTNQNVTIQAKYTDAGSGVKKIQYSYNKSTVGEDIGQPTSAVSEYTSSGVWSSERNATVYYRALDDLGNASSWTNGTAIKIDKTKPTGTITLHNGASYTRVLTVNALVTYVESDSGIKDMIVSLNGTYNPNSWKTFASNSNITLNNSQGTQTVYLWLKDKADNISIRYSDSIIVDTNKPTNNTISINNGDDYTNSKAVTLTLNSEDTNPIEMCVSQVPACDIWVPFQSTMALTLNTPGEGTKTVYVKYRDVAGNEVNQISDTIFLDTVPPATCGSTWSPAAPVAWKTEAKSQTFTFSGSADNPGGSGMSKPSYECTAAATHNATCNITIYDKAGNPKNCGASPANRIDTNPPTGTIQINGDAEWTNSNSVTLTLNATDAETDVKQMCISNTTSCSSWETYATSKAWTLGSTPTVYVWFKDTAGNDSTRTSDSIKVDTTPPTCGSTWSPVSPVAWKTEAQSQTFTLSGSTDNTGGSGMSKSSYECTAAATNGATCDITIYDKAGNSKDCGASPANRIDANPPTGTVKINGGAEWTNSKSVTLTLNATDKETDVEQMCISNTTSCSSWETYATSKTWTLGTTPTVYVWFKDTAGNDSIRNDDSIKIDTAAPTCGSFSPHTAPWKTTWQSQTFSFSGSKDEAGGSGLVPPEDSCKTAAANGAVCEITIKDNAGNSTVCTSPKNRVDTIAPICNYAGYTNSTILTVTCSDSNSGCKTSSGTISSTAKKVTLYDNAGNSCAIQCDYSTSGLITICYSIN